MTRISASAEQKLVTLSEKKEKLLRLMLETQSRHKRKIPRVPRGESRGANRLALSWAQERIWFIDRLEGTGAAYHIPMALRLRGALDVAAIRRALDTLIERHEALRTVFVEEEGVPRQDIAAATSLSLPLIALDPAQDIEAQISLHKQDIFKEHFNLRTGPLIRGRLLRVHAEEHVLLITMHHIVSDGWSMDVFFGELAKLYDAYHVGAENPLPPLPIQYADYAQWERERLKGEVLDEQLDHWRTRLNGAPPQLDLPTDRPRPAAQSYRGGTVDLVLDAALTQSLRTLAQRRDMTVFMLLCAGWSVLMSRLSAQDEVVVGTPVANRRHPEVEGLIGFFVNTLALRVDVAGNESLDRFLDHVKEVTLDAYEHQDLPFERLVEALQPQRSLSRNPIFQVMLALRSGPKSELRLPGLSVGLEDGASPVAMFDLLLSLEDRGDDIVGRLYYAADLFDRVTVESWIDCFKVLLKGIAEESSACVSDLPILPEGQRDRILHVFNSTAVAYPREKLIHEFFEDQVERTPDAVAVIAANGVLTYAELNERANQLAWYLREKGVGPDRVVALSLERNREMIVGILGILKAGGAYVPLDPGYPEERLNFMLEDTEPQVVLTQSSLRSRLPGTAAAVVEIDADWSEIARQSSSGPDPGTIALNAEDLAYVIYTSGSTGRPKGVAIEHRQTTNLIYWARSHLADEVFANTLQSTSLNFDLSVYECFVPLATGGTLHVVPNALALAQSAAPVTLVNTVPSAINALVETGSIPPTTRVVNLAGEALRKDTVERIFARSAVDRVCNLYGPSETTTYSTGVVMSREQGFVSSIGRPIANTEIYILDGNREVVPIGVPGEIYIGGAGVARGYLNRPELTAERFLTDPFSRMPNARMYKTGDLGRWRVDGTIEYLGRNDHQVKIRGFRVELGEIDDRLLRHEKVKEAVVVAREDMPGEKRLVGYIVARQGAQPGADELQSALRRALPEHMVPSAFVVLERLPLTPNGKLDRRALPAPGLDAQSPRRYVAPQDEIEAILASIWQKLLRVERVGRRDNFFELGGHSLLVVQLLAQLRRAGLSAEPRHVFEYPTLAELAGALGQGASVPYEVPPNLIPQDCHAITPQMLPLIDLLPQHIESIARVVPGGAANIQDIYPLAPLQEGMLFHHLMSEHGEDTYARSLVLCLSSRETLDRFVAALHEVIDRHDALRTAVLWEQLPQPVQVVHRAVTLQAEEISLRPDEDPVEQLTGRSDRLDLRKAPLMQLKIAAEPDGTRWYALLQTHHVIFDNEALRILLSEVIACVEGRGEELPEAVPFRNHVAQALAHARVSGAEEFFRHKLAQIDEPTAPFGLLDVRGEDARVEVIRQALDPELAARVRAQARQVGTSAATLFHAAWGLVVARTSGRDDVVYGSVLSGRLQSHAGAQRILGMFINTLPLRLSLGALSARELVEHTQRELVELLGHEQSSLAVAQRCSGIAGSAPLFSALLNYVHQSVELESDFLSSAGITFLASRSPANYPVSLIVYEQETGFVLETKTDWRIDPQRMMGYVSTAVRSLVEALERAPQTRALELPVLPQDELHRLVEGLNETKSTFPEDATIHALFEEQAARVPQSPAIVFEDQSLTYAELNSRANQLARYLRRLGIGPDRLVGLCVERSIEMLVGMLGVLKAGGAYVPLDPANPKERLEHILRDAEPAVLLTQERLRHLFPSTTAHVVALDSEWARISAESPDNLDSFDGALSSRNLAYVIYTSGSTGRPKGVMIEHRSIVNYALHIARQFDVAGGDGSLVCTSFSFDLMLTGLYPTLVCGKPIRLSEDQEALPDLRKQLLRSRNLAPLKLTPSHLSLLEEPLRRGELAGRVRALILGGESLHSNVVQLWNTHAPETRIFNHYGPTETTVGCIVNELRGATSGAVPIGQPISNTQIYILDRHLRPVPTGATGEIHIGGAGVARGYLNRPEITAERFVPDPFSPDGRGRLYKTGDLGRWNADGAIEYVGRNDHQVKIRGFRIELGEIEAKLASYQQVKDAVVMAREDVPGEKRLVAYVTVRDEKAWDIERLRETLKSSLPDYMIPSAIVVLESLPLTPNGKVDRRALPAPGRGAHVHRGYEAPQGEIEETLARIWQELLRVERVGRQDNFFELGGHSLLIVQLIARLRRAKLSVEARRLFQSPTLADLARVVRKEGVEEPTAPAGGIPSGCTAIVPEMLPLVQLQPEHIERIVGRVPGGAANIQDIYPLAPLQEGILFHHLLNAARGDAYVGTLALSLSSRQRLDELISALQGVIDRHDVLRTAVLWEQLPGPVQVVHRHVSVPVEEIRLETDRDALVQLHERMNTAGHRFDLGRAPLLRLQIAADPHGSQWYALLHLHHIVADNTAMEIVISEMVAHLQGHSVQLPAPVPYRVHIAQALEHVRKHDPEAFFRRKLADVEEPTAPFGLLDVHGDGSGIERASQTLDPVLCQRIRAEARRLSVSPATLFHAMWALVVAQTSGRDDVVFGTVLLGRLQGSAGGQRILGMFINTLPLRLRLSELTAAELVERTQQELVELLDYEQASLAVAQQASGVAGGLPLFSSLMNYRHRAVDRDSELAQADGLKVLGGQARTNYPLALSVADQNDLFSLAVEADSRVDPQRVVAYAATAIGSLMEALEQVPTRQALALQIVPESERARIIEEFNPAPVVHPQHKLLHEIFEEQAGRTPEAAAVVYQDQVLTYAALNDRADQLADYLALKGIGADALVGVCVERSVEMVVALLAVLKAGAAYVPMDPAYPEERLTWMLQDAAPRALLTQEKLRARFPNEATQIIALDRDWDEIASASGVSGNGQLHVQRTDQRCDQLAYVIYTSGSTGRPKGVMIEHQHVVNLWRGLEEAYGRSRLCRRVALNASLNFDASVQQLVQLLSGRTLFVVPQACRVDATLLLNFLNEHRIEGIDCTPSQLRAWLAAGLLEPDSHRPQMVLVGGEAIEPDLWNRMAECADVDFFNVYGPTECTVDTTIAHIEKTALGPHIGRPMYNRRVYILNRHGTPVPMGAIGQICIGGEGTGRGYLNHPRMTGERFVADPFDADPQARLYLTGDLGRWRADGNIEFLGRNDHQVKIRGFRIELGEIEAQLKQHERVRDAVVLMREDVPGEKRLVAYVTSRGQNVPGIDELREHLRHSLPEHMVPGAFVLLETLPLTPSGKLDRRALPTPTLGAFVMGEYQPPQGDIEEGLADIWRSLLRVDRVGRHDSFFDLGGHSLHAMRAVSRIRERFEVDLALAAIFESPTLEKLSARIGTMKHTKEARPALTRQPRGSRTPTSFAQERLWFLDQTGLVGSAYHMMLPLRLTGALDEGGLERTFAELLRRHEILRTRFGVHEGSPYQIIESPGTFELRRMSLEEAVDPAQREQQLQDWMRGERQQRFDLSEGPLMRVTLVRLGSQEHALVLTLHHIIADGWSTGVLVRELGALYGAFAEGQPNPLPDPTVQYADYAIWQRSWLTGETLDTQLKYWRERLADAPPEVTLPTDRPRPQLTTFRGACHAFDVSAALFEEVEKLAASEGATSFMVLLAAYQLLLARYSGQDDVVVGAGIAGRTDVSTEGLIGFFVNTLALRTDVSGNPTFRDLLRRVKQATLEAYAHQDLPFEQLVTELRPERTLSRQPIFQVALALQNYPYESLELAGIQWSWIPVDHVTAKFDLALFLYVVPEGLRAALEYATDLFDRETIEQFSGHFTFLLERVVTDPDEPID